MLGRYVGIAVAAVLELEAGMRSVGGVTSSADMFGMDKRTEIEQGPSR